MSEASWSASASTVGVGDDMVASGKDALVAGLMKRERDPMGIARGIVLLPNNRSVRAITDAFVRASGGALLLPRLVALGDPDLGEGVGAAPPAEGDGGVGGDVQLARFPGVGIYAGGHVHGEHANPAQPPHHVCQLLAQAPRAPDAGDAIDGQGVFG